MNQENKLPTTDWTVPDDKGNIDVPDHLIPLFNYVWNQLRFHRLSGKNEILTIAHIVKKFEENTASLRTEVEQLRSYLSKGDEVRDKLYNYLSEEFEMIPLETEIDEIIHITNLYMFKTRSELFSAEQEIDRLKAEIADLSTRNSDLLTEIEEGGVDAEKCEAKFKRQIEELKEEVERLKERGDNFYHDLKLVATKNKKLREALEKCKTILSCWNDTESINKVVEIAKEALKGGSDDN